MNTYPQIEILVNYSQHDYSRKWQQIIKWLEKIIPAIMLTQQIVTENIFLQATSQTESFCLN